MIDRITNDIERAIDAKAYIAALTLALTLPDICGKAQYPDAKPTERYKKWYAEHIGRYENPNDEKDDTKSPYLSADVVYSLRCSMLHQGTTELVNSRIRQPENKNIDVFHLIVDEAMIGGCSAIEQTYINGRYVKTSVEWEINVVNLCWKLCVVASSYYKENKDKFDFFSYNLKF